MKEKPDNRIEWRISAQVRSAIALKTNQIEFEPVSRLSQPPKSISIHITDLVGLDNLVATSASTHIDVKVDKSEVIDRGYVVQISPKTAFPEGLTRTSVELTPWVNGRDLPPTQLDVICKILPDAEVVPESMAFGIRPIGSRIIDSFYIRSRTNGKLIPRNVKVEGDHLFVERINVSEDKVEYRIDYRLARDKTGRSIKSHLAGS